MLTIKKVNFTKKERKLIRRVCSVQLGVLDSLITQDLQVEIDMELSCAEEGMQIEEAIRGLKVIQEEFEIVKENPKLLFSLDYNHLRIFQIILQEHNMGIELEMPKERLNLKIGRILNMILNPIWPSSN